MRKSLFQSRAVKTNGKKKTRQGQSVNTKFGNKKSKKYYKKRTRGQGK
jgi:hypothetical protein|tara:strand:- start:7725 stop:7868 length:144 start_codon:yes stop_codon:yes gene_type:complete